MAINITHYEPQMAQNITAGATILRGQLIGINSSGQAVLADAVAGTPIEAVGIALCDATSGQRMSYAKMAALKDTAWSWTPGAKLWLSGTAGGITATKPSSAGDLIQPVGIAKSATEVDLCVSPSLAVVQAAGNSTVAFQ